MAGISKKEYRRKNGEVVIKYTITYRDIFGKQRTSGMYNSEREAAKDLPKFDSKKPDNNNVTFGDIINTFMKKVNKKYAKSTRRHYQLFVSVYLRKFMEIKYLKLQPLIFQDFLDEIEAEAPFLAKNILKFCKAAANYCKSPKIQLISENIFEKIEAIALPKSKKQNLTLNEAFGLLKECAKSDTKFFPVLFCFMLTGMRQGELFALNKDDFNFVHNLIRVNKQYTKKIFTEKLKTDKSNRLVSMFDVLALFMEIYLPLVPKDTNLAFPNTEGDFINDCNLRERHWYRLLERCGYRKDYSSLHKLRAFYIDLMFYLGIPGKFTQGQVGHAKYETTYNHYASNNSSIRDAALAQANEAMGFNSSTSAMSRDAIKKAFMEILISYVQNNSKIINKGKIFDKIKEFFGENSRCEKNVRNFEDKNKDKIIQFPKCCQEL